MTEKTKRALTDGSRQSAKVHKTDPVYSISILAFFEVVSKFFALVLIIIAVLELGAGIEGLQGWGESVLLSFASGSVGAMLIYGGEQDG